MGRFFGASSVASALSTRSGATPRGHIHPNSPTLDARSKQDISTLLGIGHFYFALTTGWDITGLNGFGLAPIYVDERALQESSFGADEEGN